MSKRTARPSKCTRSETDKPLRVGYTGKRGMTSPSATSIFPSDVDPDSLRWEDYLQVLTPVERVDGMRYKREDRFAPYGYGGINGSKLRQCVWLVEDYVRNGGKLGVLSGTSIKSPQLVMGAAVARHYGLRCLHVIGGTTVEAAQRQTNVRLATEFGAEWEAIKVGYNPALQKRCRDLLHGDRRGWFYLEYGITLQHDEHPIAQVEAFHKVGAGQVRNIPPDVETLVVPAGSCNSSTSILYGLALHPHPGLRRLHLIGIGPTKLDWMRERLRRILAYVGLPEDLYAATEHPGRGFVYEYHDLHGTGQVKYHDEVPWHHGDIEFHPTYEGKVMRYLNRCRPDIFSNRTCLWIVGSRPFKGRDASLPS